MKFRVQKDNQGHFIQSGLTVVELLIILTAVAIVILISVPGSTVVLEHFRLKSASGDLISGLNLARGEALVRHRTVKLCPSSNGRFCRVDGDWSQGWLVYADGNGDDAVQEIELIQSFTAPSQKVRIRANGAVQNLAAFNVTGLVPGNGSKDGRFHLCHEGSNSRPKVISIDAEGYVQLVPVETRGCG